MWVNCKKVFGLILLLAWSASAQAETMVYQDGVDGYDHDATEGREGNPTYIRVNDDKMITGYHSNSALLAIRSYLGFDLLGIPEQAVVTSATLDLYLSENMTGSAIDAIQLSRMEHATSTLVDNEATWNEIRSGVPWGTPGGDITTFLSSIPGFESGHDDGEKKTFASTMDFVAAVQDEIDGGDGRLEMAVWSPTAETEKDNDAFVRWFSDNGPQSWRPQLTIEYTVIPEPAGFSMLLALGMAFALIARRHIRFH